MGLFNKKEQDLIQTEMTREQKDKYMMSMIGRMLVLPRTWNRPLSKQEFTVLNDPEYAGIKVRIDEFCELYKKINDMEIPYESNINIYTLFDSANYSLNTVLSDSFSEIKTLTDFENVYDELIKKQITGFYNEMRCMEVLENDDIDQYYDYASRLKRSNSINSYSVLSPVTERVTKKMNDPSSLSSIFLASNNRIIQQCLQVADNHAKRIYLENQRKEQERANNMNREVAESMFSAVTKANQIDEMLKESESYRNSDISDSKTK